MQKYLTCTCVILLLGLGTAFSADSPGRGATLYATYCADCHGRLESTDKPNRPFGRLASAIRTLPSMYHLKRLTRDEIAAIVEATSQEDPQRMVRN